MARASNNVVLAKVRGKLGNTVVFRQWGGDTLLCKPPKPSSTESFRQKNNRVQFAAASKWAKQALKDAQLAEWFTSVASETKMRNAYTAALRAKLRELKAAGTILVDPATHDTVRKKPVMKVDNASPNLDDINGLLQECIGELQQAIAKVQTLTEAVQQLNALQRQTQDSSAESLHYKRNLLSP
jgi:hypothetical protein